MAESSAGAWRYLFHQDLEVGHEGPTAPRLHRHPFWQIEACLGGRIGVVSARGEEQVPVGGVVLIPPHTAHAFSYRGRRNRFVSVKCDSPCTGQEGVRVLPPDGFLAGWQAALVAAVAGSPRPDPAGEATVAALCAALLARCGPPSAAIQGGSDPVVGRMFALIAAQSGRRLGVTELAHRLGLSASRLQARVRAATGEPPKVHHDRHVAVIAARMLRYTGEPVAGITIRLGFTDPFAFSRFFRRVTGESPRACRQREQRVGRVDGTGHGRGR